MNLFKNTTWKWWQLKILVSNGILLGLGVGAYFSEYLKNWLTLIAIAFVVSWIYVAIVWFKKN